MHIMNKKITFSAADINSAIDAFIANNAPRTTCSSGKNGEVVVYGENDNKHKPMLADSNCMHAGDDDGSI